MANERIDDADREWLLELARTSIAAALAGTAAPAPADVPVVAARLGGCFVSLHTHRGELRGCLGTFAEDEPLWCQVQRMAVAAATRDPRFSPLSRDELDGCDIEISALAPRREARAEQVRVGEHGLWVSRGARSGVLLPQVATQNAWDREAFLSHTCRKAGLPSDAWRDDSVTIEVFEAEVFSEG